MKSIEETRQKVTIHRANKTEKLPYAGPINKIERAQGMGILLKNLTALDILGL